MLSDSELMEISELVRLEIAVHKDVFSNTDDPESKVFFIKHGHVKIVQRVDEENEIIVDILGPGEFFGQTGSNVRVKSAHREEYASVIDKATICIFEKADFERALREIPSMHNHVLVIVAERVERVSERLADMLFRTARERILGFLHPHFNTTHACRDWTPHRYK